MISNRHTANIFLAFSICRGQYEKFALWMELHYSLFPVLKHSNYPAIIQEIIDYIIFHPLFDEDYKIVLFYCIC